MPTRVSSREDWSISTAARLQRPVLSLVQLEGGPVLAVGIDWSEEFHLVALGKPSEGVFEVRRVEHSPKAVDALCARIAALEPDPAQVRVVLEAPPRPFFAGGPPLRPPLPAPPP